MRPGQVIAARFEIEHLAGKGGMGEVYRARDRETGSFAAVKVLLGTTPDDSSRFAREARVLAALAHPGIVRHLAHGQTERGEAYLAMEWLEGESLSDRLARRGLTIDESVTLVRGVARALAVAHDVGIVHRDLKPSNLLLPAGSIELVKVLDFGIARAQSEKLTLTGAVVGTPWYMSPEQARGSGDIDARSDVFALGCLFFQCLTGRVPFEGESMYPVLLRIVLDEAEAPSAVRAEVPAALDTIVGKMLAKEPAKRFAHAGAVARVLESWESIEPPSRAPNSLRPRVLTATERRVVALVLARTAPRSHGDDGAPTVVLAKPNDLEEVATVVLAKAADPPEVALAKRHEGKLEALADGTLVVSFVVAGAAVDQAVRAARFALALRAELGDAPIAIAFGQESTSSRLPMGELIDAGLRLLEQASAGASPVRVDRLTAALLEGRFEIRVDATGPVLLEERARIGDRKLLGRAMPFVGREAEVTMLQAFVSECIDEGRARAVLVTAPAGLGKSRLLGELLARLAQSGDASVWMARGDPLSAGSPFAVLASMLRAQADIGDDDPPLVREQRLRARIARSVAPADVPRVTEFLAVLAGIALADEPSVERDAATRNPILMGDQMRAAWEDFVRAESESKPILFVLDDLHWGDLPTVNFFDSILRTLADRPFVVLGLARPEVREAFPKLWAGRHLQEIALRELGKKPSERLVRAALGAAADEGVVRRIVERAAGNAFYLEELIRAEASGSSGALPETVIAMVAARLEALDPEARRVLRAASVFGQVFWRGGLEALLSTAGARGPRASSLDDWLRTLCDAEVIVPSRLGALPGEHAYSFHHALVRDAAYAMLTKEDLELGHRLAGAWLETRAGIDAPVLAEHFERGGDGARAAHWYHRAAATALDGNDFAAALAWADKAIALGARGETLGALHLLKAEARHWHSDGSGGPQSALLAVENLKPGTPAFYRAVGEAVVLTGRAGSSAMGVDRRLIEALDEEPSPEARSAHALGCILLVVRTLLRGEAEVTARFIARIEAIDDNDIEPAVRARREAMRAKQAQIAGDTERFLRLTIKAYETARTAGDRRYASMILASIGYAQNELGDFEAARSTLEEAAAVSNRLGLAQDTASAQHNLGFALAHLGRLDEALVAERSALEFFKGYGNRRLMGGCFAYLAVIHLLRGELEAAEATAREACDAFEIYPSTRPFGLALLGRALLAQDCRREALEATTAAMRIAESSGVETGEATTRLSHAEALWANGELDAAREVIRVGCDRILERAAKIEDARLKALFLADNASTLSRAEAWGEGA